MRADAHYVEQLDSSLFSSPIRFIEVRAFDSLRQDDELGPSAAFVESIKRHGVLQPLLVRSRAGRHLVIAGRKRLAAAVAAGLREVPCLVERVEDDQAPILAAATNTPSTDVAIARPAAPMPPAEVAFAAFADCLTAVATSANLLSPGSTLTQAVALDLVKAEAARALQLLAAARVLKGDVSVARRSVSIQAVFDRAADQTAAERRLRGIALQVAPAGGTQATVSGDEDLLVVSIGGLIIAAAVLLDAPRSKVVSLHASPHADDAIALTAVHEGAELPHYWRSKLADAQWPDPLLLGGNVATAALVLLRAARRVAELHNGYMTLDCSEGRTSMSIVIPAGPV